MSDGRLPPRRRWVGWVVSLVLILLVLAIGWVFIRGFGAATELQNVRNTVAQLRSSIEDRAFQRVEQTAPRVAQHAALARDLTSDVVWRAFELIPWIGDDLTSFREITELTDDAVAGVLPPLIDVAEQADLATLGLNGSFVDLAPLAVLQEPLSESASALAAADHRAQRISADLALPMLGDVVTETRDLIHEASETIGAMHGASVLLPNMLGSNGSRTFLVAVQNNAELRSQGGAVQALILARAEHGTLSIQRTASAHDFPALAEPLPLDEATITLFGDAPGRIVRDATSILEFSGAAETLATRWEQLYGDALDGVVALDLVALQRLTEATGEIAFADLTGDADTLVQVLGSDIPTTDVAPAAYDALVAQAATALSSALLTSNDPLAVLGALSDAASAGHIRLWSIHPEEQAVLAASALGGTLPKDTDDDVYVDVLFNDITGGALDYYADATISHAVGECHGEPTTQMTVTWKNGAPGTTRTLISFVGPEGATPQESGDARARISERPIVQYDVTVPRHESRTITATFTGSADRPQFVHVRHTPMLGDVDVTRTAVECD
jgi:predicted aconitase with swiveling domain